MGGVYNKLTAAVLASVIPLAIVDMAIPLELWRLTSGTYDPQAHGHLWLSM
jgi:hypothetical protein